ncbi:MAG TPA: hypothetical protein ENJ45_02170, partial [Phaeodactylibacter sp.]|nr:hypothetical protein [Phaeodactylibacter sp.]
MRVFSLFFLFLLLVIRWSFAQQFNLLGDSGSESFVAVEYLPGGGFVVGGLSRAAGAGSDDISLHFFDEDGKLRHCHYFGCALSDQVFSLAVAKNGDILLGGQTHCASGTGNRAIIMRVDPYGRKLWKKTFHARAAYAIMEVDDEKIAIAASKDVPDKRADFSLSLWQKNGNILWISTEGTIYKDYAFGLTTTADNGFLLGGIKNGFHSPEGHGYPIQDSDLLFIKYDQSGAFLWQKELGEAGHDFLNKMLPSEDGNIYVVGSTQGHGKQSFDAFILKIDQNANPVWQATFGGEDFEYGMDMCLDTAGNILVCGVTNSNTGNQKTD